MRIRYTPFSLGPKALNQSDGIFLPLDASINFIPSIKLQHRSPISGRVGQRLHNIYQMLGSCKKRLKNINDNHLPPLTLR